MLKKKRKLVKILSESTEQLWNSEQLAGLLHISQRTVLRYIKELKEEEERGGFKLHTQKGKGYRFEIADKKRLRQYMAENKEVRHILFKILLEKICKLDDLAEMLHYSRSGMASLIEQVTEEAESHGLKLLGKPYVGFVVHGSEIHIRNYLYELIKEMDWEQVEAVLKFPKKQSEGVKSFVDDRLKKKGIVKNTGREAFFLKYLGIQLRRIQLGETICIGFFANLGNEGHFQDDLGVAESLLYICGIDRQSTDNYETERIYLALIYRQAFWQNGIVDKVDERDLGFYQKLVETGLLKIRNDYHMNLLEDETLVNGLILHVASSYRKYLLGMEEENYFHNNMLETYPTAYYFAVELAEVISNQIGLPLSKYEISFLGMHFASFLERNLQNHAWKAAIICKSGLGTAQLLQSRLKNLYGHLEITGLYSLDEGEVRCQEADLLITTVPLTEEEASGKAWIQVSPLLTLEEQISLENMFKRLGRRKRWQENGVTKYFCFLSGKMRKSDILEQICDAYVEQGKISPEEKAGIMERESLVSTEILDGVAMPHGLIQKESFLTFILLEHPVMWGRTRVRLVILGCFHRGDERMKQELEHIFQMLLNEERKEELLFCKTISQLEEKISEYYKK